MRFMTLVKAGKNFETGAPPDPKLMAALGKFTDGMIKTGVVLETGGLMPSSMGARIQVAGGKVTAKDGPFTETKELIGGYAILQVKSREEAVEMGKKFMQVHIDALGASYEGEMEIRRMFDPADFSSEGR